MIIDPSFILIEDELPSRGRLGYKLVIVARPIEFFYNMGRADVMCRL